MSDEPVQTVAASRPTDVSDPAALRKTLDDAVGDILFEGRYGIGFTQSMAWANRKLVLMTLTVAAGCVAQFAPLPQPKMRWTLGGFVLLFFILNTLLQFVTTYVDKEYIFLVKASKSHGLPAFKVRTTLPKYSEMYTVGFDDMTNSNQLAAFTYSVGRYFSEAGDFAGKTLKADIEAAIAELRAAAKDPKRKPASKKND